MATSTVDLPTGSSDAVPARPRAGGWALATVVLLGAALRFSTLGLQSFWLDEAYTHAIVGHGLGHALATIPKTESTPPVYYMLLWLWSRVFGTAEVGLRSLSAVCGVLTIPLLYALGCRLASKRVGLIAALLTAVNPLLFWFSQEARAYALLVLLSAVSLVALLRALDSPQPRRLLVWGVTCALALATHYFAATFIVPEGVWLAAAVARRRGWSTGRLAAAYAPILATAGALLPLLIAQNDGRAGFVARSGSLATRLLQLVKQHAVGYDEPAEYLISGVAVALLGAGLVLLAARGRRGERQAIALPACVAVGGILIAVVPALLGKDYIDSRNLLAIWPAEALVVAAGFGVRRASRLGLAGVGALAAISVVCIVAVDVNPLYQRQDWRGAARAIGLRVAGGARAIVAPGPALVALAPYLGTVKPYPATGADVREVDVIGVDSRAPGTHHASLPPRPAAPASLAGFGLAERRETDSYTALRYLAGAPRSEGLPALEALGLGPGYVVLLQTG